MAFVPRPLNRSLFCISHSLFTSYLQTYLRPIMSSACSSSSSSSSSSSPSASPSSPSPPPPSSLTRRPSLYNASTLPVTTPRFPDEASFHRLAASLSSQSKHLYNGFEFPYQSASSSSSSSSPSASSPSSPSSSPPSPPVPNASFDDFSSLSHWPADPLAVYTHWYQTAETLYDALLSSLRSLPASLSPSALPLSSALPLPNNVQLGSVDAQGFPSVRNLLLKGLDARGFLLFTNYNSAKGSQVLRHSPRVSVTQYWKQMERQIRVVGLAEQLSDVESDAYFHSRPLGSQISACCSPQSHVIEGRGALERYYIQQVQCVVKKLVRRVREEKVGELARKWIPELLESKEGEGEGQGGGKGECEGTGNEEEKMIVINPLPVGLDAPSPPPPSLLSLSSHEVHSLHERCLSFLSSLEADRALSPLIHGIVKRPRHWGGLLVRPLSIEFWADGMYRLHSRIMYKRKGVDDKEWEKMFLAP